MDWPIRKTFSVFILQLLFNSACILQMQRVEVNSNLQLGFSNILRQCVEVKGLTKHLSVSI